ncbi:MAG TPA: hypothetical protein PLO61_08100 [Fimbriimonadaceae bacterium]|nr:hypothetical protein [Fimbriimonadaceae bacterium]HRJ33431.1 hypothetical protein [Fimbriimonadaceae bacterium]
MNADKARELFSAYHEGTLELHLREVLSRELAQDATLQAEYAAFVRAIEQLSAWQNAEVPYPDDLHEKIAAKLDRHIWESKQTARPGLFAWWKTLALTGAAAATVLAVVMALQRSQPVSTADLTGTLGSPSTPSVSFVNGQLNLDTPAGRSKVQLHEGWSNDAFETIEADPAREIRSPLQNIDPQAKLIVIRANTTSQPILLAVPGVQAVRNSSGTGTLEKLALAVADFYRTPVTISEQDLSWSGSWTLKGSDASELQLTANGTLQVRVTTLKNGLLRIGR